MAGRSPARFLAPLALVGFAIALLIVVGSSSSGGGGSSSTRLEGGRGEQSSSATPTPTRESAKETQTYTIKPGDTPSGIASANDMTVGDLLELNPDLNPGNLTIGEKIKVK